MTNQRGFNMLIIIIIILGLAVAGLIGWRVWEATTNKPAESTYTFTEAEKQLIKTETTNSQIKSDLLVIAAGLTEYVIEHDGKHPTSDAELQAALGTYVKKPLNSPLTGKPYTISSTTVVTEGAVSFAKGTCNASKSRLVTDVKTSGYALLTKLSNSGPAYYCVEV